jgi:hypothetical protein
VDKEVGEAKDGGFRQKAAEVELDDSAKRQTKIV